MQMPGADAASRQQLQGFAPYGRKRRQQAGQQRQRIPEIGDAQLAITL
jgi:hypothetical protein